MKLNVSSRLVEVLDYDLNWKNAFEKERVILSKALGHNAVKIDHIGSTSVEGLSAKPIIDILIEVTSLDELDISNKNIEALGYHVKGENGIEGRRYFQKGGNQRSHHVHAFQTNDFHLLRHIAFKEYLIANPTIASEYTKLKKEAVKNSNNNIDVYIALKNTFIEKHEKIAIEWFNTCLY